MLENIPFWDGMSFSFPSVELTQNTKTESAIPESKSKTTRAVLKDIRDIERRPVEWLWDNKILAGELTVIAGKGSAGKSLLTYAIASHVTNGTDFIDGTPCQRGSVLFFPPEGRESTLREHVEANGVKLDYCRMIEGKTVMQDGENVLDVSLLDITTIENAITEMEKISGLAVRVLIIDPIFNFWDGKKDANSDADVRSILKPRQRSFP
jgi:RecA-family ATPase